MTSYYRDAESLAKPPTAREQALMDHKLPITPIDQPVLPFAKPAKRDARSYMDPSRVAASQEIAEWNRDMFLGVDGGSKDHLVAEPLQYRTGDARYPVAPPKRPGAPTIITTFTSEKDANDGQTRSLDVYLPRFQALADTGEMVIFYTNDYLKELIESLRPHDPYWHVVSPWESVWDMPNNRHQYDNFSREQPDLYQQFLDAGPNPKYNHPRLSAAFNSKAYCIFDGVQRAPFGADGPFVFYDSGWIIPNDKDEPDMAGFTELAADFIDDAKVARSGAFAGDTGVVVGEYDVWQDPASLPCDVNAACFQEPTKVWEALHFLGGSVLGSGLGMLNYAARFMQTVEDMDANGFYVGREEFVMSFLAIRYPHTIFSVPAAPTPGFPHPWPIRDCHSGRWGPDDVAALVDPVQTRFCRFYEPRQPGLPAVHGKKRLELLKQEQTPPPTPAKK